MSLPAIPSTSEMAVAPTATPSSPALTSGTVISFRGAAGGPRIGSRGCEFRAVLRPRIADFTRGSRRRLDGGGRAEDDLHAIPPGRGENCDEDTPDRLRSRVRTRGTRVGRQRGPAAA